MLVTDYRRTDLRTNVLENPFWLTSALVEGTDIEAATKGASITGTGIAAVSSTTDTITDTGSGFTTGGFLDGDVIAVSGFTDTHLNINTTTDVDITVFTYTTCK